MTTEVLSEWFSGQGHSVLKSEQGVWCELGPRVYQAIPFHRTIEPEEPELRRLLVKHSGIALRYSTSFGSSQGIESYHVICDVKDYDVRHLHRQSRQNVYRGLENCSVEPITFSMLESDGWLLHESTLRRQKRSDRLSRTDWVRSCRVAAHLPGFEVWGALVSGQLAAIILMLRVDDWVIFLSQDSHSDFLSRKPNHALVYTLTKTVMSRSDIKAIFYSLQSLDAPREIDDFKFRMGYRRLPVKQRVLFHPLITPLISSHSHILLNQLHESFPSSPLLAKAEGMVRFAIGCRQCAKEESSNRNSDTFPNKVHDESIAQR